MTDVFARARQFLLAESRLVEQRMFLALFERHPVDGVMDALSGYQNADGGLGHGLEPDVRCPASMPLFVEFGLNALMAVGARRDTLNETSRAHLASMVRYLANVGAGESGGPAVACVTPLIEAYPRAAHWGEWGYERALNPTAGIVGALYALGVAHPWRDAASAWCWEEIGRRGIPQDQHSLLEELQFLAFAPNAGRADETADEIAARLDTIPGVLLDPSAEGYGLTPLQFAPTADARWRRLFSAEQINDALDHLLKAQEPDGGWPIGWDPPSESSRNAWRGHVTVHAVRTLASYGRIDVPAL